MITQQLRSKEHIIIQHYTQSIPGGYVNVVNDPISLKTDVQVQDTSVLKTNSSVSKHSTLQSESKRCLIQVFKKLHQKDIIGKKYIHQYLASQYRHNLRPNTISSSFTAIVQFLEYVNQSGKKDIDKITRDDLSAFIEHMHDKGLKPASVKTRLGSLSAFLRVLIEKEVIDPGVLKNKMRIKLPESLPRAIDPDDIKLLLSVIKKVRDRAMVLALLRTGMRIGELLRTKLIDVNMTEKRIEIFEAQKNRVGRVVYLSNDAAEALRAWLNKRDKQKEYLFYSPRKNDKLSYTACRAMFATYLHTAQIDFKGYTLHSLRHTFASELLNAGMRLECLQQLLGHSSIEITRCYARLTDNTRREEYFKAMSIIEKGEINGHYRLDSSLPQVYEEKELLGTYS
ncbi:MAG: tyrosine-type recombinase/integrase [Deltaproteobacteria bacterium]|nr:tyrosine-type recombinase/integrase [Deltaproteobacteria bacterium]MBW2364432.1 tyrosine-type recombinase/integrase [Deltaproteobacteria bacterium]